MTSVVQQASRPYANAASTAFAWICAGCTFLSLGVLLVLLWQVVSWAWGWLDWQFITSFDSQLDPRKAGVKAALVEVSKEFARLVPGSG